MNVLIIEDHLLISSALESILITMESESVVTEAETFPEGLDLVSKENFDLIILDIDVPGGENVAMIEKIRAFQPEISILIHTGFREELYALPYLRAGADGFISKNAPREELIKALGTLKNKRRYVSPRMQQQLLGQVTSPLDDKRVNPLSGLSPREVQVLELIMEGKWTKEIATIMNLKENTISTFKKRIFVKLGVADEINLSRKAALLKQF